MGVRYRVKQLWHSIRPRAFSAEMWDELAAILTADEIDLFRRFSLTDQQHSYRVYRTLQGSGQMDRHLLVAALLHDIGKTRHPLRIWERMLIVVAGKVLPRQTAVWGQSDARGWKRPFVVRAKHPDWGAEMAQQIGCSPLTVALIGRHQEKLVVAEADRTEEERLLAWLQWADNQH